jgi:L-ascorbate metabolism protein UlaG (beta-lactamase superfamily)
LVSRSPPGDRRYHRAFLTIAIVVSPRTNRLELAWLGHATTLLELDGLRAVTDPVLKGRVGHLVRVPGAPVPGPIGNLDLILLSHAHRDHLDLPSLRLLPRETHVVAPLGAGRLLGRLGFGNVTEVREGESVELGGPVLKVTHAEHDAGRHLPRRGPVPVGYVLRGSLSVYFAGDTDLFDGMAGLASSLDVALLPVGGWGPRLPAGHLDPARAARAAELLAPRVAVPIHWGTLRPFYRRSPYEQGASPGERFAALANELAPQVEVRLLAPGERCTIV